MIAVRIVQIVLIVLAVAACVVLGVMAKLKKLSRWVALALACLTTIGCLGICAILAFIEPPYFSVKGDNDIVIPVFSEYEESGVVAYYRGKNLSKHVAVKGAVDTSTVGKYNIEYNFSHLGYKFYAVRSVTVTDTIAPELKLKGERELTAASLKLFSEPGFTATDNYDGDISKKVEIKTEKLDGPKYKVIYTAKDSSGNTATDYRIVNVTDTVAPKIEFENGKYVLAAKDSNFTDPTATATDNLDGDVTDSIKIEGVIDTATLGVQTLTYTAADSSGNSCSETLQVVVYEPYKKGASIIYLTFDDGPSDNVTPAVLDTLKRNNIRASFFINDYSEDKLPLIKRIINEGHTLAIHGTTHDYAKAYKNTSSCVSNFTSLRDKVYSATGYKTNIMRFPGGSSNSVSKNYSRGVVSASAKKLTESGWRYFDWNVDSGDADGSMSRNYIINNVIKQIKKGRHNVVLMHDYHTKATTAEALQSIIDYGKKNGFVFEAINPTTPDTHHPIAN